MAVLAIFYLLSSLQECIVSADENRAPPYQLVVCDLPRGKGTVLFVVNTMTSVGMLMYKVLKFWGVVSISADV